MANEFPEGSLFPEDSLFPEEKDTSQSKYEKISGYVDNIIYQKEENGYTVFELVSDDVLITCVGTCRQLSEGENIEALGEHVLHKTYGRQFKIVSYETVAPKDKVGIERYLGSGAIKGIGPAMAAKIVKKFGTDTFRIIEQEPERLAEIKGISLRKAQEIATQMEEKKDLRDALIFLQQYGITNNLAVKIYNTYGMGMYRIMKENPYKMAEDIDGVGFKIADEIAQKIGIHTDSDYRIRSGVFYALVQSSANGHCYLPVERLINLSSQLLGVEEQFIGPSIDNLVFEKKIIRKDDRIYAPHMYYAEMFCARKLSDLNIPLMDSKAHISSTLELLMEGEAIHLDPLQLQAVTEAIQNGVFILSGGPGTGKTTTINTIIKYFEREKQDIFLAAPTGRAAKRMTEATGVEARTIHRMLEFNGVPTEDHKGLHFERNELNPLEADVVIIDEMSMVDLQLFQALLKAIMPGTRLILVGDMDQLPSVGPGQVLKDLIHSECYPMVILKTIFRQAGESDIVVNAHRINHGEQIQLDNKSKDFFMLERNDVNVIYKHMIQLIQEKLPPYVHATPYDIQVLTPMRKGPLGVETLNQILQQYLNPPSSEKKEHKEGDRVFRLGDKVMQIKNNYQLEWEITSKYNVTIDKGVGVFNGDVGRIVEIRENFSEVIVEFDEKRKVVYPFSTLEELELAYAVTIHKSQGSEYPAVVMPLLGGPRQLFNRNLLYTGVTRAKNCVTILGSKETVLSMIDNVSENQRYTSLAEWIVEIAKENREDAFN